jgi:AcrR family transcriptional regulator
MDTEKKVASPGSTDIEVAESEDNGALDIYRVRHLLGIDSERFGLREQNKVDKLQRIYLAARRQFAEVGYDATTLRDVAKEARVALGTLSSYAESKSELVLLVFNATMPPVFDKCREQGVYDGSLLDTLTDYLRPAYTAYAEEPGLFRVLLRENVFHTTSSHAREFHRIRAETLHDLRKLIDQARENGEIRPYMDADLTARTIFFLLFASVRIWISTDQPKVETGLTELKSMIALLLDGLRSNAVERAREAPRKARAKG